MMETVLVIHLRVIQGLNVNYVCQDIFGLKQIEPAMVTLKIVFYLCIENVRNYSIYADCICNIVGTTAASSDCSDMSGQCMCISGYTGFMCSECISGWYWTSSESSCTGRSL